MLTEMKKLYYLIAFFAIINAGLNAQSCNTLSSFPSKKLLKQTAQQEAAGHNRLSADTILVMMAGLIKKVLAEVLIII
jgi:hypothetical protein